ncbi:MAG TPA: D-arabinono-1,4-lactone oxidase [Solirubrobacterales bacterium]|nr:D-arabinono-1,4-lactone oxidase [Solirubrobacterales bacterium]
MDPWTKTGEWANWAGDQRCRPAKVVAPRSREELAEAVGAAAAAGEKVSVTGSGHSFTEAAMTDQTMVRLDALRGVLDADRESGLVRVGAGTVLADLNEELASLGLALENMGDIDAQTVAGAISTGTHGTGAGFGNISARVEGIELVLADGTVRDLTGADDPELLRAARVGVGALGAISAVTLRCFPAFTLRRVDSAHQLADVLDRFDQLTAANDHFELFTFPYSDRALVLERNRTEEPPKPKSRTVALLNDVLLENWALEAMAATGKAMPRTIPALSKFAGLVATGTNNQDVSHRIFVNKRNVRFTEMEYAVPRADGPTALRRVIEWVRSNRYPVFFPIEVRVAAGDDAHISAAHERDTTYIAVHQYQGMEWRPYFEAVEAIIDDYAGRPHWGKRHFQTAATLAPRFPQWDAFQAARNQLDPRRVFTNAYAERVLGP